MKVENSKDLIITPETKIYELLEAYPKLEDKLIKIAPVFSKLKNPILRRTITKVTSIKQAALVGNVPLNQLVNELRNEVGQFTQSFSSDAEAELKSSNHPNNIKQVYDATADIEAGNHPLAYVMNEIQKLDKGETFQLITPFYPAPLIDKVKEKGFKVETENDSSGKFNNFIWK
jgi:uncharacterized protein (DUF2249 family)